MVVAAHKLYSAADYIFKSIAFHVKHDIKGYYSADFFCETFSAIARDKVIKGYTRL